MRPIFREDFEEFYPTQTLKELGYERHLCEKCGRAFWSRSARKFCGEPVCSGGYRFIGKRLTKKTLSYKEAWESFASQLGKYDYEEIRRYPVVSRWYDELYFTTASINNFQPYVVTGEAAPPANPLVVPQFCLRFPDIEKVGVTGRHYTGFIMPGQHAFNTEEEIFSKNDALRHIFDFIRKGLGVDPSQVVFHEDIWAGGGNFGPALEYFSAGLELGNQVYMEFEQKNTGYEELDAKVLDHGGGLERYAWFSQGTPTSYDAVFPNVLEKIYERVGRKPSQKWKKIGPYAPFFEEGGWKAVAKKTGFSIKELKKEILPIRDIYALADHTRSLLVAITDGALPSNVGGGHNLRNILRRCFHIIEKNEFDLSVSELLRWHIEDIGQWLIESQESDSLFKIIEVEKKRYEKSKRKASKLVEKINEPSVQKMLEVYDTHGIQPEMMREHGWEVPEDFYERLETLHEKGRKESEQKEFQVDGIEETRKLYYKDEYQREFQAKVLKVLDDWVILDKTLFYPGGGGQESDRGKLGSSTVKDVREQKGVILHKVSEAPFKVGQQVVGTIDWQTRYALMKNHTATHLINWAAREVLGNHVWQAGSHKSPKKARLDITHFQSLSFEELQEIERLANKKVRAHINVKKKIVPRTEAEKRYGFHIYQGGAVPGRKLRIVKTGEEVEACGGTHLDNTGELQLIKIINSERIQDGVVRLEFVTDEQAIESIQNHEKLLTTLSQLWDVSYDQLPKTGKRFFREWKKQGKKISDLEKQVIDLKLKAAISTGKRLSKVEVPGSFGTIAQKIQEYKSKIGEAIILVGQNYGYGISSNEVNIKKEMKKLFQKVQGDSEESKGFKKR